jgi:hypothetical protein
VGHPVHKLKGFELYGPLREVNIFNAVDVDREAHTLVWPNGADFDPAILHDWPDHEASMIALAQRWAAAARGKPILLVLPVVGKAVRRIAARIRAVRKGRLGEKPGHRSAGPTS